MSIINIRSISIDRVLQVSTVGVEICTVSGPITEVVRTMNVQVEQAFEGITDPAIAPAVRTVLEQAGILQPEAQA